MTQTLTCTLCDTDGPASTFVVLGDLDDPTRAVCPDCQTVDDRLVD